MIGTEVAILTAAVGIILVLLARAAEIKSEK
jgi:hypothetical protein